ncbi:MAG: hypothetical protein HYT87_05690 [Nitrospirae bacterium]|nr:hypothetical protein [Nitrospirota bacterium]
MKPGPSTTDAEAERHVGQIAGELSRRSFLFGVAASACGFACMAGTGCARIDPRLPGIDRDAAGKLGKATYARLHALADTVLPSREEAPFDAASLGVAERLSAMFVSQGRRMPMVIRGAMFILEYLPLVTDRSGAAFSRCSREKRQTILRAWLDSRSRLRRLIASSMRKAVMFSAYSHPDTWSMIGYGGPWVSADRPPTSVHPLGMGVSPDSISARSNDPGRLEWGSLLR